MGGFSPLADCARPRGRTGGGRRDRQAASTVVSVSGDDHADARARARNRFNPSFPYACPRGFASPSRLDVPLWPSFPPPLPPLSLVSVDGVVCVLVVGPGVGLERWIRCRSSSTHCRTARICAARSSDSRPVAWGARRVGL